MRIAPLAVNHRSVAASFDLAVSTVQYNSGTVARADRCRSNVASERSLVIYNAFLRTASVVRVEQSAQCVCICSVSTDWAVMQENVQKNQKNCFAECGAPKFVGPCADEQSQRS